MPAILTVISDDHNTHCLDEAMLDTWLLNLSPERKVEIYESEMESDILDLISRREIAPAGKAAL